MNLDRPRLARVAASLTWMVIFMLFFGGIAYLGDRLFVGLLVGFGLWSVTEFSRR